MVGGHMSHQRFRKALCPFRRVPVSSGPVSHRNGGVYAAPRRTDLLFRANAGHQTGSGHASRSAMPDLCLRELTGPGGWRFSFYLAGKPSVVLV